MDLLHVRDGLLGRAHIGFRDDLQERRTRSIQIDAGRVRESFMERFAGVLLEVRTSDADGLHGAVVEHDADRAPADHRMLVLADLVAFRQIGVEIILARENRPGRDGRPDREPELDGHGERRLVEHRQHPGVGEIDQVGLRVG